MQNLALLLSLEIIVGFSQTSMSVAENLELVQVRVEVFSGTSTVSLPFQIIVNSASIDASMSQYYS